MCKFFFFDDSINVVIMDWGKTQPPQKQSVSLEMAPISPPGVNVVRHYKPFQNLPYPVA